MVVEMRIRGLHGLQLVLITAISVVFLLGCWKYAGEVQGAKRKGRFAATILEYQLESGLQYFKQKRVFPEKLTDDSPDLQKWLLYDLVRNRKPAATALRLENQIRGKALSSVMSLAISRWKDALLAWERDKDRVASGSYLDAGLSLYEEAAGYDRIGLSYDATVTYLRSVYALLLFVEQSPNRVEVPQAIFLIGSALLKLKSVLPDDVNPDRILNLCIELYPNSIWASRAHAMRRGNFADHA
jgi:hypothetical protein